jgi:photosystem II stability/assembly factor-like uncharacterized protein
VLAVVATPHPAGAAGAASFSPVATYAKQTNVPGDLSCLPSGFCMELAYGADNRDLAGQATVSVLVSYDEGATWTAAASPLKLGARQLGVDADETIRCVVATTCFFTGLGVLLRTVDGGTSWQRIRGLGGVSAETVACVATAACLGLRATRAGLVTYWLRPGSTTFAKTATPVLRQRSPTAIDCATPTRCLVATDSGSGSAVETAIYVTSSAGPRARWVRSPRTILDRVISSVSCLSVALCLGTDGRASAPFGLNRIIRSNDGGVIWFVVAGAGGTESPTTFAPPQTVVRCTGARVCITSVGDMSGGVLRPTVVIRSMLTEDGGTTWRTGPVARFTFEPYTSRGSASCVSATACVADAGAQGALTGGLVATSETGRSWSPATPPGAPVAATSLQCTTDATCYRIDTFERHAGYGGRLLTSTDDGATWAGVALPVRDEPVVLGGCQSATTCELFALTGTTLTNGLHDLYDYGRSSLVELSTTDGWQTVTTTPVAGPDVAPLLASCTATSQCVVMVDTMTGASVASELLGTTTGTSWSSTPVNPQPDWLPDVFVLWTEPTSLSCSPSGTCLFAADNSLVEGLMVSTNFGATWSTSMPSWDDSVLIGGVSCPGTSQCDVAYVDDTTNSAFLVSTADGGETWSTPVEVTGPSSKSPPFLSCEDPMDCTVVQDGFTGQALAEQTSDGGATWTPISWDAVPLPPSGLISAGGLLTCSSTTCLVEAQTIAHANGGSLASVTFQLLDLSP